jgi:hypothetical protein
VSALLALSILLAAPAQRTLLLKDLHRLFLHGDSAHVIRLGSFSSDRLGRGRHHFISYVERGHLHGLLFQDDGHAVAQLQDDRLLANVQSARVIDVDGDGRQDVLVIFTYQRPAQGTEGLGAQVLLQRARGRFQTAPRWVANVKRRLARLPQAELHHLTPEDVVEVFRDTRRH